MAQRIFILGAGRFGAHLAARLSEFGSEVLLADKDPDRVEHLVQDGFHAVELDAEDENALKEAGVQDADAVVVSIGENMQGSILTTLLLKELKVKRLIARIIQPRLLRGLAGEAITGGGESGGGGLNSGEPEGVSITGES